jgi:hypothetical protein
VSNAQARGRKRTDANGPRRLSEEARDTEAPVSLNLPGMLSGRAVYQTWYPLLRFVGLSLRLCGSALATSRRRGRASQLTFLGSGVTSRAHPVLRFRGAHIAQVAELVDAQVSGTCGRKVVEVRVFSWAPNHLSNLEAARER